MNLKEKLYPAWRVYQRAMWYAAQTGNELGKPLRFYSETALLVLLIDKFGFPLTWQQVIIAYAIILFIAVISGRFIADIGTVKYNIGLSNKHNEELQDILKRVKRIERRIP